MVANGPSRIEPLDAQSGDALKLSGENALGFNDVPPALALWDFVFLDGTLDRCITVRRGHCEQAGLDHFTRLFSWPPK